MSLESALDEERREILKLLEAPTQQRPQRAQGSGGGVNRLLDDHARASSPQGARSPVRSMLDIVDAPASTARHASVAGLGVGVTPAVAATATTTTTTTSPPARNNGVRSLLDPAPAQVGSNGVRSMLNLDHTPPKPLPKPVASKSGPTSPTEIARPEGPIHRSKSDASALPVEPGSLSLRERDNPYGARASVYSANQVSQFEMLPSHPVGALPKRVAQGGKKSSFIPSAMSTVMGRGSDRGRDSSAGTRGGQASSKSPPSRYARSRSPHSNLNTNSFNLMPTPGKFVGQSGQVVDMDNAYRRLSDAYLARSGGSLSTLSARATAQHIRADSGESLAPGGGIRLQKDYYGPGENEAAVVESSDEDSEASSNEDLGIERRRGRKRSRRKGGASGDESDGSTVASTLGMGQAKGPRKSLSLMAAADEERRQVSAKYKVKSLLAPPLADAGAGPDRAKKIGVHPTTSFDQGTGHNTPMTSDTEADNSDIRRAQRMHVGISPISSTPESHRVLRTIIRGEYAKMQQEAAEGLRRQRTYLVATDLSDEAAHALEWTIGTVLRDGDTLLAIYAVNEETGTGKTGDADSIHGVGIGEGALALKDQAAVVGALTAKAPHAPPSPSPLSAPGIAAAQQSPSASPDSRQRSKAEQERFHAAEDISERCVRLLRKTRLQVRIVIEVIHCKSPKHLITEVIDFVDPTLVILGSRGRSALKGVLLGSFSNYLVTKSSVPVMVARKKLKKHSKKYKDTNVRLSNNLLPTKGLAAAKID